MATIQTKSQLMTASEIDRTLVRLAHEVIDQTPSLDEVAIVGIHRRGAVLGERLAAKIAELEGRPVRCGSLDITLYRDDLTTVADRPVINGSDISFSVSGLDVILVDDVLYTGRTTLVALDALFDHGRPRSVELCTLIDRGHRELPIQAGFVGKFVETTDNEIIEVKLESVDGEERVLLVEKVDEN